MDEVDSRIVIRREVLDGKPNDLRSGNLGFKYHVDCFAGPPNQLSADHGVYSHQKEQEQSVTRVILL